MVMGRYFQLPSTLGLSNIWLWLLRMSQAVKLHDGEVSSGSGVQRWRRADKVTQSCSLWSKSYWLANSDGF